MKITHSASYLLAGCFWGCCSRKKQPVLLDRILPQDILLILPFSYSLNGFSVLFARWFSWFCKPMNVPSQQDIQSRLAYVSSVDKLDGNVFLRKKIS